MPRQHLCVNQYADLTILTPDDAATLVAGGCGCPGETATLDRAMHLVAAGSPEPGPIRWSGVIGTEGEMTGDGRFIEEGALRWEGLPIPFRYAPVDTGGHQGAQVSGRIFTIERRPNGDLWGTGDFDHRSDVGLEHARQVDEGLTPGVSMDLDSVSFEIRVAKDLMESGMLLSDEAEEDEDGRVTVIAMNSDDEVMVTTDGRVRAATGVAIPAFSRALITLDRPLAETLAELADKSDDDEAEPQVCSAEGCENPATVEVEDEEGVEHAYCDQHAPAEESLVAGGYPVEPPAAWFSNPNLTEPTPLTITEDGRVYGHLAIWGTCHTAYTGQCVEPPHSNTGYAYFRTGAVLTAEGSEIPTGVITLDTLHASDRLSAAQTLAHYEHTGRGVADVAAGEDVFGIWISGAARPGTTPEQIRTLRACPLSGDWRRIGGNLELVGALAVNVQGFPVPRPKGLVAGGAMQSLVASGMLAPRRVIPPGQPNALSLDDLKYLKRLAARERRAAQEEQVGIQTAAEALAARVRSTRAAALAKRIGVR